MVANVLFLGLEPGATESDGGTCSTAVLPDPTWLLGPSWAVSMEGPRGCAGLGSSGHWASLPGLGQPPTPICSQTDPDLCGSQPAPGPPAALPVAPHCCPTSLLRSPVLGLSRLPGEGTLGAPSMQANGTLSPENKSLCPVPCPGCGVGGPCGLWPSPTLSSTLWPLRPSLAPRGSLPRAL